LISFRIQMLNFSAHAAPSAKIYGLGRGNDSFWRGARRHRVPVDDLGGTRFVANCGNFIGATNLDWAKACGKQAAAQAAAASAHEAAYCKASSLRGATGFGFSC
jgi:hypothetical protein